MAPNPDPQFFAVKAKLTPSSTVVRNLICTAIDDAAGGQKVMAHNVPPLVNEKQLSFALKSVAPAVLSVTFCTDEKKTFGQEPQIGYNKAIVTFEDPSGLKQLTDGVSDSPVILSVPMSETRIKSLIELREDEIRNGAKNREKWGKEADEIVRLYDEEVRLKEKVTKLSSGEVDEDGWQTVQRKRPDSLNREKAILHRIKMKEQKKKRLEANVADIYQYRMRNEKLGKLRLLRKKFEEDKNRIKEMRAGRKFRPM